MKWLIRYYAYNQIVSAKCMTKCWQIDLSAIFSQSAFLIIIFIELGNQAWNLAHTRKVLLPLLFSTHFLEFLPQYHYVTIVCQSKH